MADALAKFDKIQKYLTELEERRGFEEPVNAVYSFYLIHIPKYGDVFTSLERHFDGTGYKLTIMENQEWQLSLYLDLDKYLKEGEIDLLIKVLLEALGNSTVKFWNLSIDENNGPFYDIFWDDYFLN